MNKRDESRQNWLRFICVGSVLLQQILGNRKKRKIRSRISMLKQLKLLKKNSVVRLGGFESNFGKIEKYVFLL